MQFLRHRKRNDWKRSSRRKQQQFFHDLKKLKLHSSTKWTSRSRSSTRLLIHLLWWSIQFDVLHWSAKSFVLKFDLFLAKIRRFFEISFVFRLFSTSIMMWRKWFDSKRFMKTINSTLLTTKSLLNMIKSIDMIHCVLQKKVKKVEK